MNADNAQSILIDYCSDTRLLRLHSPSYCTEIRLPDLYDTRTVYCCDTHKMKVHFHEIVKSVENEVTYCSYENSFRFLCNNGSHIVIPVPPHILVSPLVSNQMQHTRIYDGTNPKCFHDSKKRCFAGSPIVGDSIEMERKTNVDGGISIRRQQRRLRRQQIHRLRTVERRHARKNKIYRRMEDGTVALDPICDICLNSYRIKTSCRECSSLVCISCDTGEKPYNCVQCVTVMNS